MTTNHFEDKKITDRPIEPTRTGYVYTKNKCIFINQ